MKVEGILKSKGRSVTTVEPWVAIPEAIRMMTGPPSIGALVVCADSERHVAGVLTERNIVKALGRHGAALLELQVDDVMSRHVPMCSPDDSISKLMLEMTRSRHRHLPVLDNGVLSGLVSIGDVVKHRLAELELETGVLRDLYNAVR